MIKILFLIHDLSVGGAEKVLINLVNNMDTTKFDITVMTLFGGGVNEQFLSPKIRHINCFRKAIPGNSHLMKILSPHMLHKWLIKEQYDMEVAYLEGPSARIISGCPNKNTKLLSWIHIEQKTRKNAARAFRNYNESNKCYRRFDRIVCVSETVKKDFCSLYSLNAPIEVLYNTNESEKIKKQSTDAVQEELFRKDEVNIVGVGKVVINKGFDRMARILKRLRDKGYPVHWYILGVGPEQEKIERYLQENNLQKYFTFLGYQTNPYKYVAHCDLFVCASFAEGFSTATTEALIVGTPICTVEVSGMKEMLGNNNEYGVVTNNNEDALYEGIEKLISNPELLKYYKKKAIERGKMFSTHHTVKKTEEFFYTLEERNC